MCKVCDLKQLAVALLNNLSKSDKGLLRDECIVYMYKLICKECTCVINLAYGLICLILIDFIAFE